MAAFAPADSCGSARFLCFTDAGGFGVLALVGFGDAGFAWGVALGTDVARFRAAGFLTTSGTAAGCSRGFSRAAAGADEARFLDRA